MKSEFNSPQESLAASLLFTSATADPLNPNAFKSVHAQKVGVVSAKGMDLDIYNLCVQVRVTQKRFGVGQERDVVVTVGNLNVSGISA